MNLARFTRLFCAVFCVCAFASLAAAQFSPERGPVALRDLVSATDPLATHDLRFDATFAQQALDYLQSENRALLQRMANSAAVAHILNHARNFDNPDVPKDSAAALLNALLGPSDKQTERGDICRQSLAYFAGPMLADPHWVADALRYLPADFRFHGTLFLTFGYDIGVAFGPNASLNCTHERFSRHSRELIYYAIHELHHTGFMTYHPPPKLAEAKSCADLLRRVEYSTQLEGMAVLAAYQRRREDHALADDPDYVALQDDKRMQADVASYFKNYEYLKSRGSQPADREGWAVIDRMRSGERLWYRVGALMAQRIEAARGRAALVYLVKQGPAQFMATYQALGTKDVTSRTRNLRFGPELLTMVPESTAFLTYGSVITAIGFFPQPHTNSIFQ